ncbi:MAG TPA: NAD-dependent epimerase/dehydratase family protein, partial [Thermoanaerobaculia bacterium]|nr:NAD-dependent epimerase/dehydratase family protein [Thermoanaerobaculia bacterium]
MKRIVVIGASGFFGRLILERLRAAGLQALGASRSQGDLRLDAEDPGDLRENLRQRDLVIDAAGPFQTRTPALVDTAMRVGFDLIDLSDSAEYTRKIYEREAP